MYRRPYSSGRSSRGGSTSFGGALSSLKNPSCRPINPRNISQHVGRQLHVFDNSFETPGSKIAPAEIEDVVDISSYSWSEREPRTILVPGSPPVWQDSPLPFVAKPDSGRRVIDANAAKFAEHPLDATVSSIVHLKPDFDLLSKDIITNRNTLRKIMGWATNTRPAGEEFRIDVDILGGKTVAFTRWEKAAMEEVVGFAGFNRSFEERMTINAQGCNGTSSHSKIVGYKFGKLELVVSFDVDACVDSSPPTASSKSSRSVVDVDTLADLLSQPSIETKTPPSPSTIPVAKPSTPLKIVSAGKMRPHDTLLKLKTRSAQKLPDDLDAYIQLHLAGAKHLYIGRHNHGTFTSVDKLSFASIPSSLDATAVKLAISTLHAALVMVVEEVRKAGKNTPKMTLLFQNGALKLMERAEQSPGPISGKLLKGLEEAS